MSDDWLRLLSDPNPWMPPSPLPGPVVTERTVVRPYQQGDGPALFRAIADSRAAILPWMVWARTDHEDESHSVYFVEQSRRAMQTAGCTHFPMGIFDRRSGELLGGTGLHDVRPGLRQAEIGYWMRGDMQGRGLCTEAVGALISSVLLPAERGGWGLRRLEICNAVANVASRRVCEKLGLRLEMRLRQARYMGPAGVDGAPGYYDMLGFAVLADEWDHAAHRARPDIAAPPDPAARA